MSFLFSNKNNNLRHTTPWDLNFSQILENYSFSVFFVPVFLQICKIQAFILDFDKDRGKKKNCTA